MISSPVSNSSAKLQLFVDLAYLNLSSFFTVAFREEEMENALVLYAAPLMGHIVSMIELAKLIHRQCPSLSITFLYGKDPTEPPTTSAALSDLIAANPSISFVHLSPPPINSNTNSGSMSLECFRFNTAEAISILRRISTTHRKRIIAFVIDFFYSTALSLANELGIDTFYFITSGAAALATVLYMPTLDKRFSQSFKDFPPGVAVEIPGLPPILAREMPEPFLDREEPYREIVFCCINLAKSMGILLNTFDELEPVAMEAIRKGLCLPDSPTPPVFNIGPLIVSGQEANTNTSRHECLLWLDTQPSRSVIFLCFGSRGVFSTPQIQEIANGLEKSNKRFLWVIKSPPGEKLDFLQGFLDRTKDRGMVVTKWAPQVAVLRHGSVGGFVTHCGWNSVLEAVVAGQPIVAWPLYAEQHLNRAALVKDMKMALELQERKEDGFVSADELARCVEELMDSQKGKEIRDNSAVMKEKAMAALQEEGSSMVALQKLLRLWCDN